MIKRLAHICIESTDLARTETFYCDVLGLKRRFDFIFEDMVFGFYLAIHERNFIEVFASDTAPDYARQRVKHLCLEVEDIHALEQHLQNQNIETYNKQLADDHTWQVWCKDPDGLEIEFHQYTEKSSQITGEAVVKL